MTNLIIGAKETSYPGWLSTDLRAGESRLDIRRPEDWSTRFAPNSLDRIVAEHCLEHLTPEEAHAALCNARNYLKRGGFLRIAVPDAYNPDAAYQEHSRPGGKGQAWARLLWYTDDEPEHKVHYNHETLSALLSRAGFTPRLLEWHDAEGRFHRNAWNVQDAPVRRYYNSPYNLNVYLPFHRFQNLSLIIDAVNESPEKQVCPRVKIREQAAPVDSTGRLLLLGAIVVGVVLWKAF